MYDLQWKNILGIYLDILKQKSPSYKVFPTLGNFFWEKTKLILFFFTHLVKKHINDLQGYIKNTLLLITIIHLSHFLFNVCFLLEGNIMEAKCLVMSLLNFILKHSKLRKVLSLKLLFKLFLINECLKLQFNPISKLNPIHLVFCEHHKYYCWKTLQSDLDHSSLSIYFL